MRFGPFELDASSRELTDGTRTVRLQEQPFEILRMMVSRPDQVVTREDLQLGLWPASSHMARPGVAHAPCRRETEGTRVYFS